MNLTMQGDCEDAFEQGMYMNIQSLPYWKWAESNLVMYSSVSLKSCGYFLTTFKKHRILEKDCIFQAAHNQSSATLVPSQELMMEPSGMMRKKMLMKRFEDIMVSLRTPTM